MSNSSNNESILRSFLCPDGVVGSSFRWWNGKEKFDFLSNKESSSPLIVVESVDERVERLLSELSVPDFYAERAPSDVEAVERGLNFIMQLAVKGDNFKNFGSDIFQTFYDISTSAEEPLRRFALLRTEVTAQMWLQQYPSLFSIAEDGDILPDEVMDFILGMYILERVGICHDCKEEVRAVAEQFTVESFFGVSEEVFKSPLQSGNMSFRCFSNALSNVYLAERIGIDIAIDFSTVLSMLPQYRPYLKYPLLEQDSSEATDAYLDQLTMLFSLIHVLSNYGELRLSQDLLPQEHDYLSDPVHVTRAIQLNDVHLLGEICHCLIVFGHTECQNESLRAGLQCLREMQSLSDGGWPARDDRKDCYSRYHATMCATSALNPRRFRGYGPADPSLLDQLFVRKNWTQSCFNDDANNNEHPPSFVDFPLCSTSAFSDLERLYKLSSLSVSQEFSMSAQIYGSSRLQDILKTQENMRQYQGPQLLGRRHNLRKRKIRDEEVECDKGFISSPN